MEKYKIVDKRLEAAAGFARRGARIADVGTDHASLPIYLVGNGVSPFAVASDINRGPLEAAIKNISAAGLSDKIETFLTDGLNGIEKFAVDDVFILGMGGELIMRIIKDAPFLKDKNLRLILQPMTHPNDLRKGLFDEGFNIVDEKLVRDRDRVYQIIVAEYDGIKREAEDIVLWLGEINLRLGGTELCELAELYSSALKKRIEGFARSGKHDSDTEKLCAKLDEIVGGLK